MSRIQCVLIEPTDRARVGLRRYTPSSETARKCPAGHGYHDATTLIGTAPARIEDGVWRIEDDFIAWPDRNDPRWPAACDHCGAAFALDDEWQHWTEPIYRRVDTGEELTLRTAPPGAMWNAWWMADTYHSPDGLCLVVQTPGGEWMIDGPSHQADGTQQANPGWTRTGTAPVITASPSILMHHHGYHAFLRAGYLESC